MRVSLSFPGQGRAKQSFKDECDINLILKRFTTTGGVITHLAKTPPTYADVEDLDFQGAMEIIRGAREMFADLPSHIRERFSNDPARLLEFIQDPENAPEALRLGLLTETLPPPSPPAAKPASATVASPKGMKPEDQLPLPGTGEG